MKKIIPSLMLAMSVGFVLPACAAKHSTASIQFAKGASSQVLEGSLKGYEVNTYRFVAKKGQLVSVTPEKADSNLQYAIIYLGKGNYDLQGNYQVLPKDGRYELRIFQSREAARRAPKVARHYKVTFAIQNSATKGQSGSAGAGNSATVSYVCDSGKKLIVHYSKETSKKEPSGYLSVASVHWGKIKANLPYSEQYSKVDNPVFANDDYMLSVSPVVAQQWQQSKINSLLSFKHSKDGQVVLQNCVPESN